MTISVFLSHRWADGEHEFTRELAKKLAGHSGISPIIDETSARAGDDLKKWMDNSIKGSDVLVFVISPGSVESPNCRFELGKARKYGKPIIPLLLRDTNLPKWLARLKWISLKDDKDLPFHKIEELVDAIQHHFEKGRATSHPGKPAMTVTALVGHMLFVRSWLDRTDPPTPSNLNPLSHIHLHMENISTLPIEVACSMRVVGKGARFGPTTDLHFVDSTDDHRELAPSVGSDRGIPLTISGGYQNGDAVVEIRMAQSFTRGRASSPPDVITVPVVTDRPPR
jgi:hypothetical protein